MKTQAAITAKTLQSNAFFALLLANLMLGIAPFLRPTHDLVFWLIWPFLFVTSLAVLAMIAHLLFDAALFRFVATSPDKDTDLEELDSILARMGIRIKSDGTRPLGDRIAGSKRIVRRLYMCLSLVIVSSIALAIIPLGGKW